MTAKALSAFFFLLLKKVSFFFSLHHFFSRNSKRREKKTTLSPHPESEPGCEVTAAVTRKVIGALTTV